MNTPDLKIELIDREKVKPDPDQVRKQFDETKIAILKNSIEKEGIIEPLKVTECKNESEKIFYQIVDGECRYRASEGVLTNLPCIILDEKTAKTWKLKANVLRIDLNPMERAENLIRYINYAYPGTLNDDGKLKYKAQTAIAKELLFSNGSFAELLKLNKLPIDIKNEQREKGNIPLRKLKRLVTSTMLDNEEMLRAEYKQLMDKYPTNEEKDIDNSAESSDDKKANPKRKKLNNITEKPKNLLQYFNDLNFDKYSDNDFIEIKDLLDNALGTLKELQKVIIQKQNEVKTHINNF